MSSSSKVRYHNTARVNAGTSADGCMVMDTTDGGPGVEMAT